MTKKIMKWLPFVSFVLLALAAFRFMYVLVVFGDHYPHWDEWRFVPMQQPLLAHLFMYNNENLQVFTNAIYALTELMHLPFKAVTVIGGVVYLVTLFVFYINLKKYVPENKRFILILLGLPCLSDFMLDNLLWPATTSPIFYFLFIILAVKYGFTAQESVKTRSLTLAMVICSVLAMNVSFALIFTVIYLLKNFYNAQNAEERRKEIMFSAIWLEVMAVVVALFWYGMRQADKTEINWSSLGNLAFYERFSYALLAPMSGFLLNYTHQILWLILLAVAGGVLMWQFLLQIRDKERQGVWALAVLICGGMAAITLFRGDLVYALTDHAVRYVFYGLFFVPVFYALLANDKRLSVQIGINAWVIIVLALNTAYFLTHNRLDAAVARINDGGKCIEMYYGAPQRPLVWYCAGRYFHNIAPKLEHFEKVFLK